MFDEPIRGHLIQTRKALIALWEKIAETLDLQGEVGLVGDVRHFTHRLPPVRTDNEALAAALVKDVRAKRFESTPQEIKPKIERTR
jgi:hypothetical protein